MCNYLFSTRWVTSMLSQYGPRRWETSKVSVRFGLTQCRGWCLGSGSHIKPLIWLFSSVSMRLIYRRMTASLFYTPLSITRTHTLTCSHGSQEKLGVRVAGLCVATWANSTSNLLCLILLALAHLTFPVYTYFRAPMTSSTDLPVGVVWKQMCLLTQIVSSG